MRLFFFFFYFGQTAGLSGSFLFIYLFLKYLPGHCRNTSLVLHTKGLQTP